MRAFRPFLPALLVLGLVLCGSCNTPTLPIPPPITEALEGPDPVTGEVEVKVTHDHDMEEAMYLMVFNERTAHFVADARLPDDPDYAFVVRIPALTGDCLRAYFMIAPGEIGQGSDRCIPWAPTP